MEKRHSLLIVFVILLFSLNIVFAQTAPPTCTPNWGCNDWTVCSTAGLQTRTCTDSNNCGTSAGKPSESQSCTYSKSACRPNWQCTSWSACQPDNKQKRTCYDDKKCNSTAGFPVTAKTCYYSGTSTASAGTAQASAQQTQTAAVPPASAPAQETQPAIQSPQPATEIPQAAAAEQAEILPEISDTAAYLALGISAAIILFIVVFVVYKLAKPKKRYEFPKQFSIPAIPFANQPSQIQPPVKTIDPKIVLLKNYFIENIKKGYSKEEISRFLIRAGNPQQIVYEAMNNV